ncbi:ASCH domain-containing protein [Zhihengliuella salsuginis]|uniref:ASCH domain-containing protein n=1 Tax=Zhihengliuella salsuginis TaxID=578222 RepID=A0ABQ3GLV6_9MICC|nr:ASCH domain-containing protein [Zhihengliuella salsuginis]GHD13783.1 hypothetical protein GCM10008096_30340 [Zhihengliuella salsuginis]
MSEEFHASQSSLERSRSAETPADPEGLPPVDHGAARVMWEEYVAATGVVPQDSEDYVVECFGDSPALADALLHEVMHGQKRATSSLLVEYADEGEALPSIGAHWVVCSGSGEPALIVRTTELRLAAFDDVDEAFAHDEGEDDRTLESWRREHEKFWRRTRAAAGEDWWPGLTAEPGQELVLERFTVVWPEDFADHGAGR